MKTINVLRIAIFSILALGFFACQKELKSPSVISEGQIKPASAQVTAPPYHLYFDPAPTNVGTQFTVKLDFGSVPPTCGTADIEQLMDQFDPNIVSYDGLGTNWVKVAEITDFATATLPLTFDFTPTQTGIVSFRAHYHPSAGGGCGFNGNPSTTLAGNVIDGQCHEGLSATSIAPELYIVDGVQQNDSKGNPKWKFTAAFDLNTCANNYVGKLQGGLVKGAQVLTEGTTTGYTVSNTAQSTVITWANATTGLYTVTYVVGRAPGVEAPITGAWSFKVNGALPSSLYGYTTPLLFGF